MSPLLTDDQHARLLANGAATARGESIDPMPVVKLFTPDAHAIWLLSALDPRDEDTAFGLCDLGLGHPDLCHVKLSELAGIRGPLDQHVMRDIHFVPQRTLSEYARLARLNGSYID